jgi:hypothetical protein
MSDMSLRRRGVADNGRILRRRRIVSTVHYALAENYSELTAARSDFVTGVHIVATLTIFSQRHIVPAEEPAVIL